MASGGRHTGSCAHATGHHCACSGCGGSLHGWQGWVEMVTDDTTREARADAFRKDAEKQEAKRKPARRTRPIPKSFKALVTDLTRLDLTRWLAKQRSRATAGIPLAPSDESAASGQDGEAPPDGDRSVTATPQPGGGDDARTGSRVGSRPDATEQIEVLARCMAEATWDEIAADTRDAFTVRRQLADHFWCDLFVASARAVENFQQGVQEIPDSAKELIEHSVRGSSRQSTRSAVSDRIIGFAVERAWTALRTAMFGATPLLAVLTSGELLRGLRILAIFICPAPENHLEVRIHAVKPLADDARGYLTEETKTRLAGSFADLG